MAVDDFRTKTIEESALLSDALDEASPGLVVIFSDGRPKCLAIRLDKKPIEIGRVASEGVFVVEDDRVSRRHARIAIKGDTVRVTDLDSRNGVFVDGKRVLDETFPRLPRLLRVGQTLFRFTPDIRPFLRATVEVTAEGIVGPTLRASRDWINRAAAAGDTLLLSGPSGSGKELAARAYHATGRFARGPFIAVNCAAIPQGLAERLLFGAKKGAYSGATSDSEGYVQAADHGTLFLDEVAELDLGVQPKLLRVLESRTVRRVGEHTHRNVDVRFLSATHRDLLTMVNAGEFREDLYFRLAVLPIHVPALRLRKEDIESLVSHFLRAPGGGSSHIPAELMRELKGRPWRGNVRELRNFVERARALGATEALAMTSQREHVSSGEISAASLSQSQSAPPISSPSLGGTSSDPPPVTMNLTDARMFEQAYKDFRETWIDSGEREYVRRLLLRHDRNVAAAAREAEVDRTYIYRLIRKHEL